MNSCATYYSSPIGLLEIMGTVKGISSILFMDGKRYEQEDKSPHIGACIRQLDEYFASERKTFDVPLDPSGTDFQLRVWQELLNIPFGKTISYLDLALKVGDRNATRAVGSANGRNPLSLIVPCHRVIGNDGKLTGYGGGLWRKQWLLEHENAFVHGKQAILF